VIFSVLEYPVFCQPAAYCPAPPLRKQHPGGLICSLHPSAPFRAVFGINATQPTKRWNCRTRWDYSSSRHRLLS